MLQHFISDALYLFHEYKCGPSQGKLGLCCIIDYKNEGNSNKLVLKQLQQLSDDKDEERLNVS